LFEGAHHICVLLQLSDGLVDIIAPDGAGTAKALELLSVFSQWDIGAHVFPRANCYVFYPDHLLTKISAGVMQGMKEVVVAADTMPRTESIATENRLFSELWCGPANLRALDAIKNKGK
jgi:hypothetical protein